MLIDRFSSEEEFEQTIKNLIDKIPQKESPSK
jgi:hypothetical protein